MGPTNSRPATWAPPGAWGDGGFVEDEVAGIAAAAVPYPFNSGADLLRTCAETGLTIAQVQMENERALRSEAEILAGLDTIRDAMLACIARGLRMEGELPGGLKVRCLRLHETLEAARLTNSRPTRSWTGSACSRWP